MNKISKSFRINMISFSKIIILLFIICHFSIFMFFKLSIVIANTPVPIELYYDANIDLYAKVSIDADLPGSDVDQNFYFTNSDSTFSSYVEARATGFNWDEDLQEWIELYDEARTRGRLDNGETINGKWMEWDIIFEEFYEDYGDVYHVGKLSLDGVLDIGISSEFPQGAPLTLIVTAVPVDLLPGFWWWENLWYHPDYFQ